MGAGKILRNCQWFLLALIGIYMWIFIISSSVSLVTQARSEYQTQIEPSDSIVLP